MRNITYLGLLWEEEVEAFSQAFKARFDLELVVMGSRSRIPGSEGRTLVEIGYPAVPGQEATLDRARHFYLGYMAGVLRGKELERGAV